MTYQQQFDKLQKEFAEASDKYINTNNEAASINGFFDLISNLEISKKEFEMKANNYYNFLAYAKRNDAKPQDIFTIDN
jgi:hypothetical protein